MVQATEAADIGSSVDAAVGNPAYHHMVAEVAVAVVVAADSIVRMKMGRRFGELVVAEEAIGFVLASSYNFVRLHTRPNSSLAAPAALDNRTIPYSQDQAVDLIVAFRRFLSVLQ